MAVEGGVHLQAMAGECLAFLRRRQAQFAGRAEMVHHALAQRDASTGRQAVQAGQHFIQCLQLGQRDNERLEDLGHGAELSTKEAVALRGGQGLLISADLRENAEGALLDSAEAAKQIDAALESAKELGDIAVKQKAILDGDPQALPVHEALEHVRDVVEATLDDPGAQGGAAKVAAYREPHIQISAPSGIGQYTPGNAFLVAGGTLAQVAPDVNWVSSANLAVGVAAGVVLFTLGQEAGGGRPVQDRGLRLHAAGGKLRLHSRDAKMTLTAEKAVTFASASAAVLVQAKQRVLATAGGAYVRLEGGGIQLHAPGKVELKASAHNWVGPQTAQANLAFNEASPLCEARVRGAAQRGGAVVPLG